MQPYLHLPVSPEDWIEWQVFSRPGGRLLATPLRPCPECGNHSCPHRKACQCLPGILPQCDIFLIRRFPHVQNLRAGNRCALDDAKYRMNP